MPAVVALLRFLFQPLAAVNLNALHLERSLWPLRVRPHSGPHPNPPPKGEGIKKGDRELPKASSPPASPAWAWGGW